MQRNQAHLQPLTEPQAPVQETPASPEVSTSGEELPSGTTCQGDHNQVTKQPTRPPAWVKDYVH